MWVRLLLAALVIATQASMLSADQSQTIDVPELAFTPRLDGDLVEWKDYAPNTVEIAPAIEDDERNRTGRLTVHFWAGRSESEIFLAARWPDDAADTEFRPWQWRGNKYRRSKNRDDMFAVRFALSGEYHRSMIADANYVVDVWVWSAGRSNRIGHASDYSHRISLSIIDDAAEYETESGNTIYIDRMADQGEPGYRTWKPGKQKSENRMPSIELNAPPSGSVADVRAAGLWQDGHWSLEMSRALDTGNVDDAQFIVGQQVLGQIAVFNRSSGKHKSISEPLLFIFQ